MQISHLVGGLLVLLLCQHIVAFQREDSSSLIQNEDTLTDDSSKAQEAAPEAAAEAAADSKTAAPDNKAAGGDAAPDSKAPDSKAADSKAAGGDAAPDNKAADSKGADSKASKGDAAKPADAKPDTKGDVHGDLHIKKVLESNGQEHPLPKDEEDLEKKQIATQKELVDTLKKIESVVKVEIPGKKGPSRKSDLIPLNPELHDNHDVHAITTDPIKPQPKKETLDVTHLHDGYDKDNVVAERIIPESSDLKSTPAPSPLAATPAASTPAASTPAKASTPAAPTPVASTPAASAPATTPAPTPGPATAATPPKFKQVFKMKKQNV